MRAILLIGLVMAQGWGCTSVKKAVGSKEPAAEKIWASRCAMCHGKTGRGDSPMAISLKNPDMSGAEFQSRVTDDAIMSAIKNGVRRQRDGRFKMMPPIFGLEEHQIEALVKHVRGFARNER